MRGPLHVSVACLVLLAASYLWWAAMPHWRPCGLAAPTKYDAKKLQVLYIGDSVSKGVLSHMNVPSTWHVFHPGSTVTGGCRNTLLADDYLDRWVGNRTWDFAIFNFGLHDAGFDYERVPVAQYTLGLQRITASLKLHARQLMWVSTTPVPSVPLSPQRAQCDILRYNAAAEAVMRSAGVPVLDLHGFVLGLCGNETFYEACPGVQRHNDVHFTASGYARMAAFVLRQASHV